MSDCTSVIHSSKLGEPSNDVAQMDVIDSGELLMTLLGFS